MRIVQEGNDGREEQHLPGHGRKERRKREEEKNAGKELWERRSAVRDLNGKKGDEERRGME